MATKKKIAYHCSTARVLLDVLTRLQAEGYTWSNDEPATDARIMDRAWTQYTSRVCISPEITPSGKKRLTYCHRAWFENQGGYEIIGGETKREELPAEQYYIPAEQYYIAAGEYKLTLSKFEGETQMKGTVSIFNAINAISTAQTDYEAKLAELESSLKPLPTAEQLHERMMKIHRQEVIPEGAELVIEMIVGKTDPVKFKKALRELGMKDSSIPCPVADLECNINELLDAASRLSIERRTLNMNW